jgi:hypothetical protein
MKGKTKKSITLIISLLLVGHILLFYALPFNVFVLVFIAFTILFFFIEWQNAIMISVSLAITTLFLNIALNLSGISDEVYYRPHEMFSHPDGRYKQNIHFEMMMPHGDLKALSLYTKITPEPRNVIFQTDSLGYRNSKEYSGQKYLLVGDSFVVGNGTTQQEIITSQLLKKYGIDTYNLAYPGGIKEYANSVKSFKKYKNTKPKVILFLFEGNDFPLNKQRVSTPSHNRIVEKLKHYYTRFNDTGIYRFTYSTTQRILATKIYRGKERVEVRDIGGIPVAFYKEYIAVTEQNLLPDTSEMENYIATLNNDISHIYFIPTKYRVYYNHLNHERDKAPVLPNKQWELVQLIGRKLNIPTTNLTPALVEESDRLLKEGVLTYWRDDTHWNKHGISVAAEIVKNSLVSHN